MKRLILMTTLAAALLPATAASAWPGRPSDPPAVGDPAPSEPNWRAERDRGYDATYDEHYSDRYRDRWMTLSAFTPARKGRETVYLNGREKRIDQLKIKGVRGAPIVKQVIVKYRDGQYERMPVNRQLRRGSDTTISLDRHRRVDQIMVLTDPAAGGA